MEYMKVCQGVPGSQGTTLSPPTRAEWYDITQSVSTCLHSVHKAEFSLTLSLLPGK
jgi:hypothetical protein